MSKLTVETAGDIVNFVASDITKVFDGMLVRLQAEHRMQLFLNIVVGGRVFDIAGGRPNMYIQLSLVKADSRKAGFAISRTDSDRPKMFKSILPRLSRIPATSSRHRPATFWAEID